MLLPDGCRLAAAQRMAPYPDPKAAAAMQQMGFGFYQLHALEAG